MDVAACYQRARTLFNSIEFQLQQLEQADALSSQEDDSMQRHALSENLNRLASETALLERTVQDAYGGVAAASVKSDLWRRCAAVQAELPCCHIRGTDSILHCLRAPPRSPRSSG